MKGTRLKAQGSRIRTEAILFAVRRAPYTVCPKYFKRVEPVYVLSRMQQFQG